MQFTAIMSSGMTQYVTLRSPMSTLQVCALLKCDAMYEALPPQLIDSLGVDVAETYAVIEKTQLIK